MNEWNKLRDRGVRGIAMMFLALDTDKKVHGPLGFDELERAIGTGILRPQSLVSRYGGRWHLAFSVPELRAFFLKYRSVHEPAVTRLIEAETTATESADDTSARRKSSLQKAA